MASDPVVLTKEQAQQLFLHETVPRWNALNGQIAPALLDLATGKTAVVPVITEAQAREFMRDWYDNHPQKSDLYKLDPWALTLVAGMAALRYAGVLPTGEVKS